MGDVFSKAQAKVSDAKLAGLHEALYAAEAKYQSAVDGIWLNSSAEKVYTGRSSFYYGRRGGGRMSFADAIADVQDAARLGGGLGAQAQAVRVLNRLGDAEAVKALARLAVHNFREWENHGQWSRFFMVTGGHIHSSTGCHTLYPTTRIGWLPDLSGETEADAVAAHGALLCTVCFPSAPVEWTDGRKADDDEFCAGALPVPGSYNPRLYRKYGICRECDKAVSITSTGKVRKHRKV
jgi:hypothetical protein